MAQLVSPGIQVTVTEDPTSAAGPQGTVPLLFIATQENKTNTSGTGIAPFTTKENAGRLKLLTSQSDLIANYGIPYFPSVNGTPVHGSELAEYGLLAAWSYLGRANQVYIIRADVDLASLSPQANPPSSEPLNGTYWFNIASTSWGVFVSNGASNPGSAWKSRPVRLIDSITKTQTNLIGTTILASPTITIINTLGNIVINGTSIALNASTTLSGVVNIINGASLPNIQASAYRVGEMSSLLLVDVTGSSINLAGSSVSILTDLGLTENNQYTGPNDSFGNAGDFSVMVLSNDNQIWQKLWASTFTGVPDPLGNNHWYRVGSAEWKAVQPNIAISNTITSPLTSGTSMVINNFTVVLTGTTLTSLVNDVNSNVGLQAAGIVARESNSKLYVVNKNGGPLTISDAIGTTANSIGLSGKKGRTLFYAPHTKYPTGSLTGDVWIRTTTPNGGANYVVQRYNSATNTWNVVTAPFFSYGVATPAVASAFLSPTSVSSVSINSGGTGYTSAPTVAINGGGGSGATASAAIGYGVNEVRMIGGVLQVNMTSTGSGYISAPTVSFVTPSGETGSGATGTSTLIPTSVASINVTAGGSGFTSQPTINFTGGSGSGLTAQAVFSPTSVNTVTVASAGTGFTSIPTVVFNGGGGAGAVATASLKAVGVTVVAPGSGYTASDTLTVTGGTGTQATLTVSSVDGLGAITGLTVATGGSYTALPTLPATVTGGTGSAATVSLSFGVNTVTVTTGGAGYTGVPTALLSGGGGSGASLTTALTATSISSYQILTAGSGYTSAPSVTVTGGSGSGATATTTLTPTGIASVTITAPGSTYSVSPIVSFSGGGGSNAAGTAILNNGGTGWTSTPAVSFSGGSGTGAAAYAVLSYSLASLLTKVSGGSGYSSTPTISFSGGGGSGATATATLGKTVALVGVTATGSGYTSPPAVTFSSGNPTTAATGVALMTAINASISAGGTGYSVGEVITLSGSSTPVFVQITTTGIGGAVTGLTIVSPGSYSSITGTLSQVSTTGSGTGLIVGISWGLGTIQFTPGVDYETVPTVTITGGAPGVPGTASATLSSTGTVKAITVGSVGFGYTSNPSVVISGGGGAGASFTASVNTSTGVIKEIIVTNPGSGYVSAPTAALVGGGGSGVTTSVKLTTTGSVISVTMSTSGSGYTTTPTVVFSGGGGSGAVGTVNLVPTSVATVAVTRGGGYYTITPNVVFSGGGVSASGAIATATVTNGTVSTVNVTSGGTGYTSPPIVSFETSQTTSTRLNEADKNASLALNPSGSGLAAGALYVAYNIERPSQDDGISSQIIRRWDGTTWSNLTYEASVIAPTSEPTTGSKWYTTDFQVDIMVGDGQEWFGYHEYYPATDPNGAILSGSEPTVQTDGTPLVENDIWIDTTDLEHYPKMFRWSTLENSWISIDTTDQTTPFGVVFADARYGSSNAANAPRDMASMLSSHFVDPDAPDPRTYPAGMMLFNTRFSTGNVKEWRPNWFRIGIDPNTNFSSTTDYTIQSYDVGERTFAPLEKGGAWVTVSGLNIKGAPYMLRRAQRQMVVKAMQAAAQQSTDARAENNFFNLMAAPGYVELIDEMISLNQDKKQWVFTVGDTPLRLRPDATSIRNWALNANNSATNDEDGLVTADSALALYYPWGYSTNVDGSNVVVPPSHMALATYNFNDTVGFIWSAPAGLNRGLVTNATSVGYLNSEGEFVPVTLSQGQIDTIYSPQVCINPISLQPGQNGLVLWGQRTRAVGDNGPLSRVNVARLMAEVRYRLDRSLRVLLWEFRDNTTYNAAKLLTDQLLGDIANQRGIRDYLTIVDDSNNPPDGDPYTLNVDVIVSPASAIEYIYVPIRLVSTATIPTNNSAANGSTTASPLLG